MSPVDAVTRDAPTGVTSWPDWFRSLLPEDAVWQRCCIGIPDEPERHIWVTWAVGRRGWEVQQVSSWYEIRSGRTEIVLAGDAYPLRRVVAVLRVLGALPAAT